MHAPQVFITRECEMIILNVSSACVNQTSPRHVNSFNLLVLAAGREEEHSELTKLVSSFYYILKTLKTLLNTGDYYKCIRLHVFVSAYLEMNFYIILLNISFYIIKYISRSIKCIGWECTAINNHIVAILYK